jgi:ABC-type glycerol-3-phosphate transport system substrate-binding protein
LKVEETIMERILRKMLLACVALALLGSSSAIAQDVKLWSFIDPKGEGARSEALQGVIDKFEAANPGSKLDINIVEWDQIVPSLMRAAQAGKTPDIAMVYSPNLRSLIAAGALRPLDDCLSKAWSDADRADAIVLPVAKHDGKIFAVPYELRVFGFFYRADLVDKPPASFDELLTTAKTASSAENSGLGMTFNAGGGSVEAIEWFVPMVVGMGGKLLNDDGSAAFNSPQVMDLLARLQNAVSKDKIIPQDVLLSTPEQAEQLAQSGRLVFIAEGSQEASSFKETATGKMKWSFMPPPGIEPGTNSPAALNGWNLVIPKAAKNTDGACQLIKTWTSPEVQRDQAIKAGYLPMRASVSSDPAFQTPDNAYVSTLLNYAAKNPLNFAWPDNTDLLNEVLSQMIERTLTGQMPVAEAVAAAEKSYNSRRQ